MLISKRGNCPYSQKLKQNGNQRFTTFSDTQHHVEHLAYKINEQFTIVVSNRTLRWHNYLLWFPYIFMCFFVLSLVLERFCVRQTHRIGYSLSNQIQHSLVGLLIGSFVIVGTIGAIFIQARNNRQQRSFLEEKTQALANEFTSYYKDYVQLTPKEYPEIENLLHTLADIYTTDINLYDTKGNLILSSRPEIFQYKLIDKKMATRAYYQLIDQGRTTYSREEHIENLQYMSSYIALINNQNKIIGYLHVPNFSDQEDFTQEFAGLIVGLLNLFILLLIFASILSVFIAKKITTPLIALQEKMQGIDMQTKNEKIHIDSPEEVAGLLENYNKMIDQLEASANTLAKAEREMAWQEMARQIAHEIKNPLTPMKLSIQLLNRAWDEKDDKFEMRLKKISKTIIEQIDTLSDTATSFSDFAKLSKVTLEPIDIKDVIENCLTLFNQEEHITITLDCKEEEMIVIADKEKAMRLCNNLIKNAIQAIPSEKDGQIHIKIEHDEQYATISISDNGRGISDEVKSHIFELHFTTKSTGSGFGLAICKNIVESCHGEIWFESVVDEGTTFFVKLPRKI